MYGAYKMGINSTIKPLLRLSKFNLNRSAHIWSPLAAAFNNKTSNKLNLNILSESKGLFDVPELRNHEGFYVLKEKCIIKTDELINEAISPKRKRKMVEIFDEMSDSLCKVADLAEFIRIAHPSATYSKAAEIACVAVSGLVEKLNTNRELYQALKNVVDQGDIVSTTEDDDNVAKLFLFDFEQCGIHLPEKTRTEVVDLNNAILHLGQHFVAGSSFPRVIQKKLVPENIRHLFNIEGDNVVISGLSSDSNSPLVREFAYKVYLHPDDHQEHLLTQLLSCRHHLAKICGFETYSERALKGSLAEDPQTVTSFLNLLSDALKPRAQLDFNKMLQLKKTECGPNFQDLSNWDVPYYTYKIRKDTFRISNSEYSLYFSLGSCMEGLNLLMQHLYGISFVSEGLETGECWTDDVHKLAVVHESEGLLGYIYCDLYERVGKQNQDCHFTIQGGRVLPDGSYQLPIVVLMLNLPPAKWNVPSLLSPGMVDNLFHEMGHAVHSMLARTTYQHVTGTRCSTDFAEVPSVLMEYFASDPRVLELFAKHYQTGEKMPKNMLHQLCYSKHLFSASDTQMQVFYSVLDQILHGKHPLPHGPIEVLSSVQNKYYNLAYVAGTAWHLRFSHLVGYGAKYYSYLMSRAVASCIWQTYFESDPLNRTSGEMYRHECLAFGGGKPPKTLVGDFLRRKITPDWLVKSLVREIDDKSKEVEKVNKVI